MTDDISLYGRLSPWKPDHLAGFRVGDTVDVPNLGRCLVVALMPPSLLQVTTSDGGMAKVGWRAASKVTP